ncbi:hypothetical protein [Bdellovibrio reynosensis]|uniref:Outer membrane protein beta-barrel domain-containing protein n=1 Tax=Bdellovibrio reynosensis TaxID=2835041 RepID=A0ABY4C9B4_9BACT|nr:hypothetical protein [Bdellovibrio reynosensis]UOF01064.1 hypothetical protein MNR06_15290 [Bdellovibrio reynosensis]
MKSSLFLLLIFLSPLAQARVFNINKENFAAYFLGTTGASNIGTSAVDDESSQTVTFDDETNYNFTGEFGLVYSRPWLSLRFGFEILRPWVLETKANNGTDDLYTAKVDLLGYIPKVTAEINLQGTNTYRSFLSVSAGTANLTMKNDYTLTAAGSAAYAGVTDHSVEAKGTAPLLAASLGYEGFMTDTTTILVEFGYRQLNFDNMKYSKDVATFSGAKTSGSEVLKVDGEKREFDFTGGFISIGFRFYM